QGRYDEAEPLYRRALAILEKVLGAEHPAVATSLNNLAELYRDQGRYDEAEPLYRRALAILEKGLGPEHPTTTIVRANYAALLEQKNKQSGEHTVAAE
ncbi:MAG: tetratricopeptide repeat protein, partial [bacterium]|nr:tetratricopeptide repeat protein [bacterium]